MWFRNLLAGSIANFQKLSQMFITHYFSNQKHKHTLTSMFLVKQRSNKSLRDFVARFKEELLLVDDAHSEGAVIAFKESLRKDSPLVKPLVKYGISNIKEVLFRVERYIRLEEEPSWRSDASESTIATVSTKPSIDPVSESQPSRKKQGNQAYFFQSQNSERKRKFPPKEN